MNAADKQMQQTNKCNNYHAIECTHVPIKTSVLFMHLLVLLG